MPHAIIPVCWVCGRFLWRLTLLNVCRAVDSTGIDQDAVRATQCFAVIGLLITIPLVIVCVLCDLKSVMPSAASVYIDKLLTFRQSKYFKIPCLVAAGCFFLAFFAWIAVHEDLNEADGGVSWAFMFLSILFLAVLGFLPYVAPSEAKGANAGSQSDQKSTEGASASGQPANREPADVEESVKEETIVVEESSNQEPVAVEESVKQETTAVEESSKRETVNGHSDSEPGRSTTPLNCNIDAWVEKHPRYLTYGEYILLGFAFLFPIISVGTNRWSVSGGGGAGGEQVRYR